MPSIIARPATPARPWSCGTWTATSARCSIVRADAKIRTLDDLKGKTLILGSSQAAEATVLPIHFLNREGLSLNRVKVHSLDGQVDLRGNPCSSEVHVLKALQEGRGQAGIIGERLWKHLSQHQPDQVSGLRALWVSPAFSHCVFTASKDFDKELAGRFTELMLAMDPNDPLTAEAMRLEGTRKWVAGSQEGFQELLKALEEEPRVLPEQSRRNRGRSRGPRPHRCRIARSIDVFPGPEIDR